MKILDEGQVGQFLIVSRGSPYEALYHLAITTGMQGTPMTVTLDSTGYTTGTFTGVISVTATTTDVLGAPQAVTVTLRVLPEVYRVRLPVVLRSGP